MQRYATAKDHNSPSVLKNILHVKAFAFFILFLLSLIPLLAPPIAEAGLLSLIRKAATKAGSKVDEMGVAGKTVKGVTGGTLLLKGLEEGLSYIRKLPDVDQKKAIVAGLDENGAYRFINSEGLHFSATSPDELSKAFSKMKSSADIKSGDALSFYISDEMAFSDLPAVQKLTAKTPLSIIHTGKHYPLHLKSLDGTTPQLRAQYRRGFDIRLKDKTSFSEAIFQLDDILHPHQVRLLDLRPNSKKGLEPIATSPKGSQKIDVKQQINTIDPEMLALEFSKRKRQKFIIMGQIENGNLIYKPAGQGPQTLAINGLRKLANEADVDLILLGTKQPHQPGARQWLFKTGPPKQLQQALQADHFGQFLNRLKPKDSILTLEATPGTFSRQSQLDIIIHRPQSTRPNKTINSDKDLLGEIISQGAQSVLFKGVEIAQDRILVNKASKSRTQELNDRLVPYIPSIIQYLYIAFLVLGLFAFSTVKHYWLKIYPFKQRSPFQSSLRYYCYRLWRAFAYFFFFTPLAGPLAFPVHIIKLAWKYLTLFFKIIFWPFIMLYRIARPA